MPQWQQVQNGYFEYKVMVKVKKSLIMVPFEIVSLGCMPNMKSQSLMAQKLGKG